MELSYLHVWGEQSASSDYCLWLCSALLKLILLLTVWCEPFFEKGRVPIEVVNHNCGVSQTLVIHSLL